MFPTRLAQFPIPFASSALYVSTNLAYEKSASVLPSGPCVSRYHRTASSPYRPEYPLSSSRSTKLPRLLDIFFPSRTQ